MGVLWEYVSDLAAVDYYTDRDSMFAVAPRPGKARSNSAGGPLTQIGRALRELGIGWIAAIPASQGASGAEFSTDQDRLIKELRLAKVKTMQAANDFWRRNIGRNGTEVHAPAGAKKTCIARWQRVSNWVPRSAMSSTGSSPTTTPFPITASTIRSLGSDVQAGMKRQSLRVELWLNGELKARYQGPLCGHSRVWAQTARGAEDGPRKEVRKDHNAGGKSHWMDGFWDKPSPPLWQVIDQ